MLMLDALELQRYPNFLQFSHCSKLLMCAAFLLCDNLLTPFADKEAVMTSASWHEAAISCSMQDFVMAATID